MAQRSAAADSPQKRIEAECARRGRDAFVADCVAVLRGGSDPDVLRVLAGSAAERFFDGAEHFDTYWFRVWALRGLLWVWAPKADRAVRDALGDDAWRVREMAAKVVAKHHVRAAAAKLAQLRDDPVPRVRTAAERAAASLAGSDA
jgi:hypothetical protein